MISRSKVINNARQYLRIQEWSPSNDEHAFRPTNPAHTFHSAFRMVAGRQYNVMPYCYGGFETVRTFIGRINAGTCPGGWDRVSGRSTKYWYDDRPDGLGYRRQVPRNLAGIDCSGYVSMCWQIARHGTRTLPNICLEVDRLNLKRGDILNRRRNHVRIFNRWIGARVQVYEAAGLPRGPRQNYQREFRANDRFGRVVRNTLAWDRRYTPLSPFPQYEVMEPTTSPVMEVRPTFRVRIRGSGDLELQEFVFDNACVHPQIINNPSSHTMDLNYTPSRDLSPSRKHTLYIRAMNRVVNQSFVDKFRWRFSLML